MSRVVPTWWDMFTFDQAPRILCPDCDQLSPVCSNVQQAAVWVNQHLLDCEGAAP